MKTLSLFAAILFSMFSINTSTAQSNTETIKVWGNCGMCKTTIEKAAKKAGAKTANWNEDSKELKVTYATSKTSSAKIQEAIAKVGYDTQDFTADNKVYDNLHGCCKYERKTDAVNVAETVVFSCPMKCEGDKTYDKNGQCPKCGMNLKEQVKQDVVFSCPMKCEGDKTYDKNGQCPKCGMDMKKSTKDPVKMEAMKMYACPMHPEVASGKPGKCSKCGMDLKKQ